MEVIMFHELTPKYLCYSYIDLLPKSSLNGTMPRSAGEHSVYYILGVSVTLVVRGSVQHLQDIRGGTHQLREGVLTILRHHVRRRRCVHLQVDDPYCHEEPAVRKSHPSELEILQEVDSIASKVPGTNNPK